MKKAITARWLICSDSQVLQEHGFIFESGKITEIVPNTVIEKRLADNVIAEATDVFIAMPSFINTHTHQYGLVSHGAPVRKSFVDFEGFLKNYWWPDLEDRVDHTLALATAELSCAMMLETGVTAFCDTLEAPFVEEGTLEALADKIESLGMRAIVSLESSQRVSDNNGKLCLDANVKAVRHAAANLRLVKGAICTHTTFTCDAEFIAHAAKLAQQENCLMQFHLSESSYEPSQTPFPTEIYKKAGALGAHVLASQCVAMSEKELDLLAATQTRVAHMPLSNCEVGGGIAPVPDMLERGICVGLGTDGYIDDFFTLMKATFLLHKASKQRTDVMPAHLVFRMATEYGARCLGLEKVGTLTAGNMADFILLQDGFHAPVTRDNIFDQIVVHGEKAFVSGVHVNGIPLYSNGTVQGICLTTARQKVKSCIQHFWDGM